MAAHTVYGLPIRGPVAQLGPKVDSLLHKPSELLQCLLSADWDVVIVGLHHFSVMLPITSSASLVASSHWNCGMIGHSSLWPAKW